MSSLRVYADFHNADTQGRLRLNCIGTMQDLAQRQICLQEGLSLMLYSEELEVEGEVQYSTAERLWVAVIDWEAIREIEVMSAQVSLGTEHDIWEKNNVFRELRFGRVCDLVTC